MRSSELRAIEEARAADRPARARRVVHRDVKPRNGWNPRTLKNEVLGVFRDAGARVWREETST
jgi:hypothetical protein